MHVRKAKLWLVDAFDILMIKDKEVVQGVSYLDHQLTELGFDPRSFGHRGSVLDW